MNNKWPYGGHLGWIWASSRVLKRRYFHSRINRYSDKTRCASVQLLKDSTVKLILLAGDICENPGPTSVTHQCSVCQKKVAERHRAISCDICQLWCHIKCGRISIKEYKQMINTLDLVWGCPACNCMNNIPQQMGCPPCLISDSQHELEAQHQQQANRPRPKQMQQQQQSAPEKQNEAEPTEDNEREVFKALKEKLKCKGLSIGHANVRGLCKHLNEIKILLENTVLDVLALTETHLNSNISDNELRIDGYSIKRKGRINREGGGCAIYYKESSDIEEMEKYNTEGLEALWIEAKL